VQQYNGSTHQKKSEIDMPTIPDRLPSVAFDRVLSSWQELNIGEFQIQLEMQFDRELDIDRIERALELTIDAQPILGCKFVTYPKKPYWQRLDKTTQNLLIQAEKMSEYELFKASEIDAYNGPQLKACVWRSPAGDLLLLKVAHHATDAGGVKDIAAIVSDIYNRLATEPSFQPEPNIYGSRDITQITRNIPWHAYPLMFVSFIRQTWSSLFPAASHTLSMPSGSAKPLTYVIRHLTAEHVARLAEYGRMHQATLNDIIVAALYRALAIEGKWNGTSQLRLTTTVDLRKWYLANEKAEGICNLSSFEFLNLGRDLGSNFSATLERVSAIMRRRKAGWLGVTSLILSLLIKRLSYRRTVQMARESVRKGHKRQNTPNNFTNMGEIPQEAVNFGVPPLKAWLLPPMAYPPMFAIGMSGYAGNLTLSAGVCESSKNIVERFFDRLLSELP